MGLLDKMIDTAAKKALIDAAGEALSKVASKTAGTIMEREASQEGVKVPKSACDYSGCNYEEVAEELRAYGFVNIAFLAKKDLIKGWMTKPGAVEEVSIAGKTDFKKGQKYPADSRIVISYHAFRNSPPILEDEEVIAEETSRMDMEPDASDNPAPETTQKPSQLRCKGCNALMEIDFDKGITTCPYCGSTEAISESDSVKIERMRQKAAAERRKHEKEEAERQERKDAISKFKATTLSKVILGFVCFTLLISISSFRNHPFASILMLLSGAVLAFSWIVGAGLVKNVKQSSYLLFVLAGFALFFIAFSLG